MKEHKGEMLQGQSKFPKYIFLNGEIVPYPEGKVHVQSQGVRYASNVFEGIRGYWNEDEQQLYLFRLIDHYKRLQDSMKLSRFDDIYEIDDLIKWTLDITRKNEFKEDIHVRPQVFLDGMGGGMGTPAPLGITIPAMPMGRYLKEGGGGVKAMVSSWRRIDDASQPPRIKCAANYHNGRLALTEAFRLGYDTAIMLTSSGKVAEEARACIFIVRDGIPITPPVTCGILESITRSTLLRLFPEELGIDPVEREIDRTELYISEEAFFCGSGAEVTPISSIDDIALPGEKVTSAIRKVYFDVVRGKKEKYRDWLYPVY